jgi:phage terminase small subunit
MARAPKPERVKRVREVKIDPAKNATQERRRIKRLAKEVGTDPIERAAAIAVLGAAMLDDPD